VTPLAGEELVVLGADGAAVELQALKGRTIVLVARPSSVREVVEAACAAAGFGPVPVLEVKDVAALRALVGEGVGVAIVPASWAAGAEAAPLAERLLYEPVVAVRPGAPPAAELVAAALADSHIH
jgi:DNA-binding transcriptional LysR family regulator